MFRLSECYGVIAVKGLQGMKNIIKLNKSGPAIFMYAVIALSAITFALCFSLYYIFKINTSNFLWSGIVSFMIMYHLWLRIIMGNVTKLFKLSPHMKWFRQRSFEKHIYKLLRVKKWKNKVPTYNPELFSLKNCSFEQIAYTMTKAETDHWINELISLSSLLFALVWGRFPIFLITCIAAMLFDGQFIIIQRYNRPRILKLAGKKHEKGKKTVISH